MTEAFKNNDDEIKKCFKEAIKKLHKDKVDTKNMYVFKDSKYYHSYE